MVMIQITLVETDRSCQLRKHEHLIVDSSYSEDIVILNVLDTFFKKCFQMNVKEMLLRDTIFCKRGNVFFSFQEQIKSSLSAVLHVITA